MSSGAALSWFWTLIIIVIIIVIIVIVLKFLFAVFAIAPIGIAEAKTVVCPLKANAGLIHSGLASHSLVTLAQR